MALGEWGAAKSRFGGLRKPVDLQRLCLELSSRSPGGEDGCLPHGNTRQGEQLRATFRRGRSFTGVAWIGNHLLHPLQS